MLKELIASRTGANPKASNNKALTEGGEGALVLEARSAMDGQKETLCPPTPLAPRDLQEALAEGDGTAAAGGADTALPGCDAQAEEADGVRADDGEPACKSCSEMLLEEGTDYHISADLAIDGRPTAWCNYCQARAAQLE